MLPPFIIEQIRQREEQEKGAPEEQPRLEIPRVRPHPRVERREEEPERGVVIVDLMGRDE
jgi:hypothetical protein